MPGREQLIGHLRGECATGEPATIEVYQAGNAYRLNGPGRAHLCPVSIRDLEELKREAFRVYRVWNCLFEPV